MAAKEPIRKYREGSSVYYFMKTSLVFLLLLVCLFPALYGQKTRSVNPHVQYMVDTSGGSYDIRFTFMDPFGSLQEINLSYPIDLTSRMAGRFGIPSSMFDKFLDSEQNRAYRRELLEQGMFMEQGKYLAVDKNAMVDYYAPVFCKPVAAEVVRILQSEGRDGRKNRIETAMYLVQDIPYDIPDKDEREMHYGGVMTPPEILIRMFGDCDSKAILFAGILAYLIDPSDVVFLNQKEHVLTAVRGEPGKGHTFIRYEGDKFLLAETAGPAKRRLGEKGRYFRDQFAVEPVTFSNGDIPPIEKPVASADKEEGPAKTTIRNNSSRQFRFGLSIDRSNWQDYYINSDYQGEFSFEKDGDFYIRIREAGNNNREFKLQTGRDYVVEWNRGRKRWEVIAF